MGSRIKGASPPSGQPAGISAFVAVPHVCVVITMPCSLDGGAALRHSYTHLAVDVMSGGAGAGRRRHDAGIHDGRAGGGSAARGPAGRPLVLMRLARAPSAAGLEWTAEITATSVKVLY